jgi:MFS family permease
VRRWFRSALWGNADFRRLFAGATVSYFGSLVSGVALPLVAILTLDVGPSEIALISLAGLIPGFATGLVAGAWVDRLRRRPILIGTDLIRAGVILTVPVAAWLDVLTIWQLVALSALLSVCGTVFDVADNAYLPTVVPREDIAEANAKLSAGTSVAEFAGFSAGGVLVQLLTPPVAMLVDAGTFLWSAAVIRRVEAVEEPPKAVEERTAIHREITDGLTFVRRSGMLLGLAGSQLLMSLAIQVVGTVYMLYVNQVLGFSAAALGVLFAVGGIGSLAGSTLAGPVTARFGAGRALVLCLVFVSLGQTSIAFAREVSVIAVALLVVQQLTDAGWLYYEMTLTSLRQVAAPNEWAGRVNGTFSAVGFAGSLLGAGMGGLLGEVIGIRPTLVVGTLGILVAAVPILLSPVRGVREVESVGPDVPPLLLEGAAPEM